MNHFLLHLLISDIGDSLRDGRIESIRCLRPLVSIRLAGRDRASGFLVVILSNPGPFCYYGPRDPLGESGAKAFTRVYGDRISTTPQPPADRVLRLPLLESKHTLSISLYGSSAKIRVEGPGSIVESLDLRESGSPIDPPSLPGESIAELPDDVLVTALDEGRTPHGTEEALLDAFGGLKGELDAAALVEFRNGVRDGTTRFYLGTQGRGGRVVPLPVAVSRGRAFRKRGHLFGPFDSAREACAGAGELMTESVSREIRDRLARPLVKRIEGRTRLAARLRAELEEAASFDAGRREANTLAAYQCRVPPGAGEVELPDLYTPEKSITIRLDPATPVKDQIEKRFKRAAKLERSREALSRRIGVVEKEVRDLERALSTAAKAGSFPEVFRHLRSSAERHGLRRRAPARADTPQEKRYRRFDLDPHWFVLVGRSDRENDDITFRVAAPDDIRMHAQQTPGSHVVLRSTGGSGNPSRKVLEAAAGIAAFFSKARHAGLVPVIYTHRKYVRKFRGARPGEVTCEREKTIFAEPRLPEQKVQ